MNLYQICCVVFAWYVCFGLVISQYFSFKLTTFRFTRFYSLILKVHRVSICGDLRVFWCFSLTRSFGMVVSVWYIDLFLPRMFAINSHLRYWLSVVRFILLFTNVSFRCEQFSGVTCQSSLGSCAKPSFLLHSVCCGDGSHCCQGHGCLCWAVWIVVGLVCWWVCCHSCCLHGAGSVVLMQGWRGVVFWVGSPFSTVEFQNWGGRVGNTLVPVGTSKVPLGILLVGFQTCWWWGSSCGLLMGWAGVLVLSTRVVVVH